MLIVPGRPSADGLTWWFYSGDETRPAREDLSLTLGPPEAASSSPRIRSAITIHGLGRPGEPSVAQQAYVIATTALVADREFTLTHIRTGVAAASRTLPSLNSFNPVSIGFGSCYGRVRGKGIDAWANLSSIFNDPKNPLRFRVLCGDQIYIDLDPADDGAVMRDKPPLWQRYIRQWQFLPFQNFLVSCPTIMMADDHEFWNNYPDCNNLWNWWGEDELGGSIGRKLDRAFSIFQAALNIAPSDVLDDQTEASKSVIDGILRDQARTFELDLGYVVVLLLDVRTRRTSLKYKGGHPEVAAPIFPNMPSVQWLANTVDRLRRADVPCVLILSQPLIEMPRASEPWEENLPEYPQEYAQLWEAIFASKHRPLVLSGDLHWSRLYCATNARSPEREMYELISSPLSRIKSSWLSDPTLPESREGAVMWESGALKGESKWHRWPPGHVFDDMNNYATITFMPMKHVRGTAVGVKVSLWPLTEPVLHPVRYKEFILKPQ